MPVRVILRSVTVMGPEREDVGDGVLGEEVDDLVGSSDVEVGATVGLVCILVGSSVEMGAAAVGPATGETVSVSVVGKTLGD